MGKEPHFWPTSFTEDDTTESIRQSGNTSSYERSQKHSSESTVLNTRTPWNANAELALNACGEGPALHQPELAAVRELHLPQLLATIERVTPDRPEASRNQDLL